MSKYYRVKKDTPAWTKGAILELNDDGFYGAISDLWDTEAQDKRGDSKGHEYSHIVENSPLWFERVYNVSVLGKTKYLAKEAAKAAYDKLHQT